MKLDGAGCSPAGSHASDSVDDTRELPESIASFPTSNQPLLDTVLKDMLVSLRSSLQADMMNCMHRLSGELREVESRVDRIENKMGEFASTINDLVDASEAQDGESEWIKKKIADIEDRSRRNNLKIRGIPELVQSSDLRSYASDLFSSLLLDLSDIELTVDRIHRLPKPSFLPDKISRDVILRMHFFHVKDRLMPAMRKRNNVPSQYHDLQFYPTLSQHTLQRRRSLNSLTKALRNHNISYRWGFPTKLIITKQNREFTVDSLDKGISLLREWEILLELDENITPAASKHASTSDWKKVTQRNAKSHK